MAKPAKKFAITPLGDRVIVKPSESTGEKKLASGIIIPPTSGKERPGSGIVVAVGPGKYEDGKLIPLGLKKGDEILFSKYSYQEIKVEDETYIVLESKEIFGVIE